MKKNIRLYTITILLISIIFITSCTSRKTENESPSQVYNIFPALSDLVDENNFYAKWTKSIDPEGQAITYIVNFAKTTEGLDDPQYYETKENYFLMPNLSEGAWYWQVTAKDTGGKETPSPVWNFTINGEGLPQPVNLEEIPPDPGLIVSKVENTSFTLDWPAYEDQQNPSHIIQYTINVYEKDSFSNIRNDQDLDLFRWLLRTAPATTAHTTDTSHTFQNMKSETFYDWVIIAQNNASQTSIVGSSGVKTGNSAPTQPELLNPTEGATDVATDVTLNWSASTDPDGDTFKYYVYIDTVKNTNRNVTVTGINETHNQPEGLEKGRTYYWFILVKDDNGAATRTPAQTFMTQSDGMDIPHTPSPTDASQDIDALVPPLLQWEHDKKDQPITYTLYLSDNPKTIPIEAEGLNQQQYQIPDTLQGDSTYYWQVAAVNTQTAKTTKSGVWTFKTAIIPSPTQTRALTNTEGTQIEITYDKAMADPTGKHDQYTVKKNSHAAQSSRPEQTQTLTTTKIEHKPGTNNQYLLSLETPVQSTDTITIDYTQGTIQAQDGTFLVSYTDKPVTNKVPGQKPILETAIINSNGQTIDLGFDKAMQAPTATEYEQFGVLVNGYVNEVTAAELKTGDNKTITLSLDKPIGKNNQVHVSYTRGTIQSTDGADLESFQNKVVNTENLEVIWVVKNIGWNYSTIQSAIDGAEEEATVMVWPGRYKESLTIDKPIHLMSSDPASETVQTTTIIDGNEGTVTVAIGTQVNASERVPVSQIPVIIEGFTITNAMGTAILSFERDVASSEPGCGILINDCDTIIRKNLITENGTITRGAVGIGINSQNADIKIHDNTISHNSYNVNFSSMEREVQQSNPGGAGIYVFSGSPKIYLNIFLNNTSNGNGGAIAVGSESVDSSSRMGAASPVIYANTISDNSAQKGGGIFVYDNAVVNNADGQPWNRFNVPNATEEFVEGNDSASNNNTYSGNTLLVTASQRNGTQEGEDICFEPQVTPAGTITAVLTSFMETDTERWDISYSTGYQYLSGTVVFGLENFNPLTADATVIIGEESIPLSIYDWATNTATITNVTVEGGGKITLSFLTAVSPASLRNGNKTIKSAGDADGEGKANLFSDTQQFLPEIITNKPINPNPSINKLSVPLDEEFTWENENTTEPFTYDFYLGTNADDLNLIGENLIDLSFAPIDGLNDSTQYFWQVVSKSMTSIVYSPIWSFKTTNCISSLTYGGEGEDYSYSIVPLPDDGLLVGAISNSNNSYDVSNNYGSYDVWVMKLDSNREIVWEKNYGGSNQESSVRVLVVADGNYLIVANSSSNDHDCTTNHGNGDIWMAKVHADNGAIIWDKCFGGSNFDNLGGIELSDEGNIVIVGSSWSSDGDVIGIHNPGGFTSDIWFFEVNQTNGELIQQKCYGGDLEEVGYDISKTTGGGYIIAGSTYDYDSAPTLNPGDLQGLTFYGHKDIWIIKIADDGEIEWSQTYGTADLENPEEVEETEDGGYLFMASSVDLWIEKIDTLGNSLFQNKMTSHGFFYSMHKISDQYIVVGHTSYNNGVFNENRGDKDIWQLAFDQDTNLLWKKSFGGSNIDRCFDFCLLPNGNLMTAAITWSTDGDINQLYGERDVWLFESTIP